jgi:hypothetical protein
MNKWIASLSLVILLVYALVILTSQGQIFGRWDPAVSYNPWAVEWSYNRFPSQTWDYPQLLSCNWSLTYTLIGNLNGRLPLEFFPSAIMGLFPFFMLLMLWNKMLATKSGAFGLALIVTGLLMIDLLYAYFGLGYADIPVAAMGFAAVMLLNPVPGASFQYRSLLWGAFLCAGAAVTKQAGLWLTLLYPLLSYCMLLRSYQFSKVKISLILSAQVLIILAIVLPWYLFAYFKLSQQALEWSYLTHGIYEQASIGERLQLIWRLTGLFFWACFAIACLSVWRKSAWRWSFIGIAIPLLVIWLFYFSYDNRNLSLALPFIGVMAAEGIYQFIQVAKVQVFLLYLKKLFLSVSYLEWLLLALLSLLLIGWQNGFNAQDLNAYQMAQKKNLGDPELNQMLYHTMQSQGFTGKILTDWPFLSDNLPALSPYVQTIGPRFYGSNMLPAVMQDTALFLMALKAYPDVRYILVDKDQQLSSASFRQYLAKMQQLGKLSIVGQSSHFILYKIISPLQ